MPETERDLVRKAQHGDQAAFAALVRRYQAMVYNLAYACLGDAEAAADAAQETFLRAWRSLRTFAGHAAFSTWLYTIAHRTSLSLAARRPKSLPLSDLPELTADEASDPLAETIRRQEAATLRRALCELPPAMRLPLVLYHYHDLSYEEIARVTGQPIGTVRTHLHRGRARLRQKLAREGTETECAAR